MDRITPEADEEKIEAASWMAMHAMMASAASEILAIIAISGRRPTDNLINDLVAERARDPQARLMIRSKIDDCLTIAELLKGTGEA